MIATVVGMALLLDYKEREKNFLARTAEKPHYLSIDRCTYLVMCDDDHDGKLVIDLTSYPTREACKLEARRKIEMSKFELGDSLLTRFTFECIVVRNHRGEYGDF